MSKLITVIFHELEMEKVDQVLTEHEVSSYTFYKVKGKGRHCNSFSKDSLLEHIKMEIYLPSPKAIEIKDILISVLNNPVFGEGIVSISDVESLIMVRGSKPS